MSEGSEEEDTRPRNAQGHALRQLTLTAHDEACFSEVSDDPEVIDTFVAIFERIMFYRQAHNIEEAVLQVRLPLQLPRLGNCPCCFRAGFMGDTCGANRIWHMQSTDACNDAEFKHVIVQPGFPFCIVHPMLFEKVRGVPADEAGYRTGHPRWHLFTNPDPMSDPPWGIRCTQIDELHGEESTPLVYEGDEVDAPNFHPGWFGLLAQVLQYRFWNFLDWSDPEFVSDSDEDAEDEDAEDEAE